MKRHLEIIKTIIQFGLALLGIGLVIANMIMVEATWSDIYHRNWEVNTYGWTGIIITVVAIVWLELDR